VFASAVVREDLEAEPGTYLLTDFLVRSFELVGVRGLGLDRHPDLRDDYFRHYTRVLWLAQRPTAALALRAGETADYLGLRLEISETGESGLAEQLERLLHPTEGTPKPAARPADSRARPIPRADPAPERRAAGSPAVFAGYDDLAGSALLRRSHRLTGAQAGSRSPPGVSVLRLAPGAGEGPNSGGGSEGARRRHPLNRSDAPPRPAGTLPFLDARARPGRA